MSETRHDHWREVYAAKGVRVEYGDRTLFVGTVCPRCGKHRPAQDGQRTVWSICCLKSG